MSAADGQTRKKQGVSGECSTTSDAETDFPYHKKESQ